MIIPTDEISDSQNQPVSCAEITVSVSCARIRSRFISKVVTAPQIALRIAAPVGFSFQGRHELNATTASIRIGTSQSKASS